MTIRRARPDEAPVLSDLALRSKAAWGYSAATLARWHDTLTVTTDKIDGQPVWVYESAHAIVGFYALRPLGPAPHDWELDDLWVDPAQQRRGIGAALMRHAIATARSFGAAWLTIDADPNAEPFYVACGAERYDVCAAPIAEDATRVRPQLRIDLAAAGK